MRLCFTYAVSCAVRNRLKRFLFHINFGCTAHWLDMYVVYEVAPGHSGPVCSTHSHYGAVDSVPCAVTTELHSFLPAPNPPPLWQSPDCPLYPRVYFCLVWSFCSLDSAY